MKIHSRLEVVLGLAIAAAACGTGADVGGAPAEEPAAASAAPAASQPPHYLVIKLRSLGGTVSSGNSINDLGFIGGTSNRSDGTTRAALWFLGLPIDLGTLGGPSSGIIWPVKNLRGIVSGIAETNIDQPLGESWSCSAFLPASGKVCRGFVWEGGRMRELPTFGGDNGFATGTNNLGQTVGWAENQVHDPTCNAPGQVLQFRAALWGPGHAAIRELPPFGSDSTSAATGINDHGQAIGISGDCSNAVGGTSARHALLWQNGTPTDLGNIGGVAWNTPMALNERGDVVGFANQAGTVPDSKFNAHAFFWTAGQPMKDLKTFGTDTSSQALGLNERDDVVGLSCGGGSCRAVLWWNGQIVDLNGQLAAGSTTEHLFAAGDINDFGIITGQTLAADQSQSTFIAIPVP